MKRMESEAVLRFSIYISFKLGLLIFKFQSFENVRDFFFRNGYPKKQSRTICPLCNCPLTQEQKEVEAVQERITENIEIISRKKTLHDSNLIINCLKNHFIFYNLSIT